MKKRMVLILIGLCVLMVLGGCKKNDSKTDSQTSGENVDLSEYVTLGDYKGIEQALEIAEVTEEDIQAKIDTALASNMITDTSVAVKNGDILNIDYEGKLDGVAFDGGTAQGASLEIGSNSFIDGFEEKLIGVKIGETVDLNLTFPDPYKNNPDMAGKDVVFTVTVNSIQPEFNLDFVKANTEYTTIEDYKKSFTTELEAEKLAEAEENRKTAIWQTAVSNSTVKEYPQSEVDTTIAEIKEYYEQYASMFGMEYDDFVEQYLGGMTDDDFTKLAQDTLNEKMVMYAIAKAENITVSDEAVTSKAEELATSYGYESGEAFLEANDKDDVKETILIESVKNFVVENAASLD